MFRLISLFFFRVHQSHLSRYEDVLVKHKQKTPLAPRNRNRRRSVCGTNLDDSLDRADNDIDEVTVETTQEVWTTPKSGGPGGTRGRSSSGTSKRPRIDPQRSLEGAFSYQGPTQPNLNRAIIKVITHDLLPLQLVDSDAFRGLLTMCLGPTVACSSTKITIPSRRTIGRIMYDTYIKERAELVRLVFVLISSLKYVISFFFWWGGEIYLSLCTILTSN